MALSRIPTCPVCHWPLAKGTERSFRSHWCYYDVIGRCTEADPDFDLFVRLREAEAENGRLRKLAEAVYRTIGPLTSQTNDARAKREAEQLLRRTLAEATR